MPSIHDRHRDDIYDNPLRIGIVDVIREKYKEFPIELDGVLLGEVDILFILQNGIHVPIEYKCHHHVKSQSKALDQCLVYRDGISRICNTEQVCPLYISEFDPYEIRRLYTKNNVTSFRRWH